MSPLRNPAYASHLPDRWLCVLTWPGGREEVVLEDGMVVTKQNMLHMNPHLDGRDIPEMGQQLQIKRVRKL